MRVGADPASPAAAGAIAVTAAVIPLPRVPGGAAAGAAFPLEMPPVVSTVTGAALLRASELPRALAGPARAALGPGAVAAGKTMATPPGPVPSIVVDGTSVSAWEVSTGVTTAALALALASVVGVARATP